MASNSLGSGKVELTLKRAKNFPECFFFFNLEQHFKEEMIKELKASKYK